jgi:hypothetical protein
LTCLLAIATINEDKSYARFCHHVAALFPDMICNFYSEKSHKIANYSAITEAEEEISTDP